MVTCSGCGAKVFIPGDIPPLHSTPCPRCGHPVMMPLRIKNYELRDKIGSGGMGTVYRAFDLLLERSVAVKLMKRELVSDAKALKRFTHEAKICASLNHTNIIHIYVFDEWEGLPYIVMELADQGSLDSKIEKLGRLPELEVLDIGIKIASALDLMWKHKLLHRDVKPGNILFNYDNEPKLVDFGLARKVDGTLEFEEAVWATPYYVAPERVKRENETFLSDMYSLGGTLYHALTGHVPFEAPTIEELLAAHVQTPLTPPHLVVPEITLPTSEAIVKAMAKNPEDRFQSYDEFIMALHAARSQLLVKKYAQPAEIKRKPKWLPF